MYLFYPEKSCSLCYPAAVFTEPVFTGICLFFVFLKLFYYFNYLSLAALGLRCCAWAFSSCRERGLLFVAVRGLLIAVALLVAEHGL